MKKLMLDSRFRGNDILLKFINFRFKTGLTLTELMIASAIISIIMLGISTFFVRGIDFFRISEAKIFVQRDARHCLELINKNLRQAEASSVVIDRKDTNNPPYSRISFDTIKGESIQYYQDITGLYQEITKSGISHKNRLTDNLENISFIYPKTDDPSIIHISMCLVKIPHPYIKGAKALQLSVEKVRIMN